ncbi:putative transporter C1002.16c-like protein 14 [Colletotrichum chlorophyti]|uniref:Putative transporter C1002.16c-like protein 14 n=1 Tax=Colletotrichum chlorophyti TaxID=708187 RepID=A0A1Q8RZP5_9PEZI|nr:putative transporter C1002.16c-like protein 14 [Colletotrichum chlorophyti]
MSDTEKRKVSHTSNLDRRTAPPDPDAHLSADERAEVVGHTPRRCALERKLVWRLDKKLIPWLCLLYLLAFLHRTNIGNAKIAGMNEDLEMSHSQYRSTLAIFFVSYAIFEPLTNILLKSLRPSLFIPSIIIFWGASMTGMGFVNNWNGLMAARWFLGLAEAGLFPGVNYYLSCWYKRSEFGIRAATFFSAAALSGSFGGAISAGISLMSGVGNRPGWSWIFIIEGVVTLVLGILSFWMVQDFPHEAKFLSKDDRARVIRRLMEDHQSSAGHEKFKMMYFWQAVRDWKTWLGMAVYMGCDMPMYAFSLFLPTIIEQLGLNTDLASSQLLTIPPYAVAAFFTVFIGWVADRYQKRGLCNVLVSLIGIIGFAMLIANEDPRVKYAGTFLGALGLYPCISNTITWVANNVEGVYKRGVVLGFVIGWGNLNGIVSSNIYFHGPQFQEGHGIVLAYMAIFLCVGSVLMTMLLAAENKKRRDGKRDNWVEGFSEQEIEQLGDWRPSFLYTL